MYFWLEITLEIVRFGLPLLLVWYAAHKPKSAIGRLAQQILVTRSPKPEIGETEQQLFVRYGFWSMRWAVQLLLLEVLGGFVWFFQWREAMAYQTVFEFMLPLLVALAIIGSLLLYLRGIYHALSGSSRVFRMPENAFVRTGNINQ
jgi:hypothetical protein